MSQLGKYLVGVGLVVVLLGSILWVFGSKLNWFGNLPGDLKVERESFRFYAPITSMFLLSATVSIILWLVRKFLG